MEPSFNSIPSQSEPEYTRPPDDAYTIDDESRYRQHQAVNHVITKRLINRITGRGDQQEQLFGNDPSNRFFAGVLANQYRYREAQQEGDSYKNIAQNVAPFSVGLKFRVDEKNLAGTTIEITPSAKLFYQRFPTLEEQLKYADQSSIDKDQLVLSEEEREVFTDGGKTASGEQSLLSVYERLEPDFETIEITGSEIRDLGRLGQTEEISIEKSLDEAEEAYYDKNRIFRDPGEETSYYEVEDIPESKLTDEETFEQYLETTFSGKPVPPLWSGAIRIQVTERNDGIFDVTVSLINTHGEDLEKDEKQDHDWQAYFFDAGLSVESEGETFRPFSSEEIRETYQYEGDIYAIGENCTVERVGDATLETRCVPIYEQPKYHSRETIKAPFETLAYGDIDEVLKTIETEMERAHQQYENIRENILSKGKNQQAKKGYKEMLDEFEDERERFHLGRQLIANNDRVEAAFRALNETFDNLGEEYTHWYLFQIVYIVMSLPDIVAQASPDTEVDNELDVGDVIYFPTGGGKTEAYLGLVVFTAFHDRLRGKDYGMTALTKFPLRLLSLQQLQRIADVLCQAELIRREHPDMEGDKFSVGYFVGANNTPNKTFVSGRDEPNNVRRAATDEAVKDEWLIVTDCPYCDPAGTVEVTGDTDRMRIIHQCTNPDCPEVERQGGDAAELPVYITDEEVYRYAPTFVVSTIDKIAIAGWQRRMRTLFGRVKYRCEKHGYTSEQECFVGDEHSYTADCRCDNEHLEPVEETDPPSLVIQDELHLLREEFGAFDSHYETFLQQLVREYTDGEWQMKIVAATATIEGAGDQVNGLYWRKHNIFPSRGPRLRHSFYAYEDPYQLGREMVGVVPRTISKTRAINTIIRERAMIVQEFASDPNKLEAALANIDEDVLTGTLDLPEDQQQRTELLLQRLAEYKVQVSYNIAKTQSDRIQRTVKNTINNQLEELGDDYRPLTPEALTGETDMDTVRDALARLEADNPDRPIDIIIATSMISHGVDIDSLNFISFMGMPRNTAEYIQAYSRVGRKYTGTVFVLFDAMRARDRSHYTQFNHYHQYQDLLVEATPLERWAQFAIDRTMPGIVVGLFLQHYHHEFEGETDKSFYQFDGYNEALGRDLITKDEALEFVMRAYAVTEDQEREWSDKHGMQLYRDRIRQKFNEVWDRLLENPLKSDPRENFISNVVEGDDEDEHGPMMSLRDIDKRLGIAPNRMTGYLIEEFREGDH